MKPPLGRHFASLALPFASNGIVVSLVAILVLAFNVRVRADVYTSGVALSFAGTSGMVSAWTQPNLSGDGASVALAIDNNLMLSPTAYSVGIGHVWYSVAAGTVIDPAFAASAPPFVNAFTGYLGGRIQLSLGQTFLLGFWLDANTNGTPGAGDRFGWASFTYNQSGLSLNSSAIESTGTGIIAGTTTAVPEPSTAIFLLVGFAVLIRFVLERDQVDLLGGARVSLSRNLIRFDLLFRILKSALDSNCLKETTADKLAAVSPNFDALSRVVIDEKMVASNYELSSNSR